MNWIVYDFSSVCIRLTFVINLGSLIETICVFAQNSLLLCHNIITFFGIKVSPEYNKPVVNLCH